MEIKEIWKSASREQRDSLTMLIMMDKVSFSAAYSWCTGARRPMPLYREKIRGYVKEAFGIEATAEELFPEKNRPCTWTMTIVA